MRAKAEPESRLLNASELEMVSFTQYPAIGQLPVERLKVVGRRLRQAHVRAKDISARQQREIRGKVDPRAANPTQDNSGTIAKAQVLHDALQRVEDELRRREEMNGNAQPGHTLTSCTRAEVEQPNPTASGPGALGIGRDAKKRQARAAEGGNNQERGGPRVPGE